MIYYEFDSAESAYNYFSETCSGMETQADAYKLESDYGYMVYGMSEYGELFIDYLSDAGLCTFMFSANTDDYDTFINGFFTALGAL